jgi:hypothetical protein
MSSFDRGLRLVMGILLVYVGLSRIWGGMRVWRCPEYVPRRSITYRRLAMSYRRQRVTADFRWQDLSRGEIRHYATLVVIEGALQAIIGMALIVF